jgi:diguanylate cyclase (GGDEF)-like protein/PAS domain S-box-containing protein
VDSTTSGEAFSLSFSWMDLVDSPIVAIQRGEVIATNESARELLGSFLAVGKPLRTSFDSPARDVTFDQFEQLNFGEHLEVELTLANGYQTLELRARGALDSAGTRVQIVALRDVTSEQAAQLTVLYSGSRHRAVLDGLREGVVIFDERGSVVDANRAASFIFANVGHSHVLGLSHNELLVGASVGGRELAIEHLPTTAALVRSESTSDNVLRLEGRHGPRWVSVSCRPIDLSAGPQGAVLSVQDVTAHTMAESDLAYLAHHDPLTGLINRSRLRMELELAVARSASEAVSVLVIDLDGFKDVNDSQGHPAGDQVLIEVAHRLQRATRPTDRVARLGGDEFAVLLGPNSDASVIANRLIAAISESIVLGELRVTIGASIGIASYRNGDDTRIDQLLAYADTAMYAAKRAGKGIAMVFEHQMLEQVMRRTELRTAMDKAIGEGEFTLVYQPNVRLRDRAVVGFEALLRWTPPGGEPLAPDEFIPIAEDTGQIVAIGRWVLEEAVEQLATWQRQFGRPNLSMAINVSARQLTDSSFVGDVARVLAFSGVDPTSIMLELTETMLIADPRVVAVVLAQLRKLGVLIAIDDYGSGNASISYLRNFAVDVLKVDRSLILAMDEDLATGRAMVKSITDMAASLKLTTIAEGIEREDQAEMLADLGCDEGQGFHLARPLVVADAEALLANIDTLTANRW